MPPEDYRQRQRANLIAIAIVAALVIVSIVLLVVLRQGVHQETCFAARHRNCTTIDEDK